MLHLFFTNKQDLAGLIDPRGLVVQEIDKPNSVPDFGSGDDHFSRPMMAHRLKRPTREMGDEPPLCASCETPLAAWPCSRWGLPGRRRYRSAGELLSRLFTLTSYEAVCFCGPAPRITAPGRYPASRSVEFGLSSCGSSPPAIASSSWTMRIVALRARRVKVCNVTAW